MDGNQVSVTGAVPTTVLSHRYWVQRYGSDTDVLGQTVLLNNQPYSKVGATGLSPALRGSGHSPAEALRAGGPRFSSIRVPRTRLPGLRDLLVSGQIAICVVLLFVAGLVLRTLETTRSVDPGFEAGERLAS